MQRRCDRTLWPPPGYNIYPAAPQLTEAQRQGSLATGLPLCWGHEMDTVHAAAATCPAPPGRSTAFSLFHSESSLYGGFVWARRVLNSQKRWFPVRAVGAEDSGRTAMYGAYLADIPALCPGPAGVVKRQRFPSKSVLYSAFVWARRVLKNSILRVSWK